MGHAMASGSHDPVTGRQTTGHEWNGIEELDTPVPKVVFFFLGLGILAAIILWLLYPTFPLGSTYTKGLLGIDQQRQVSEDVKAAAAARSVLQQLELVPAVQQHVDGAVAEVQRAFDVDWAMMPGP